MFFCMLWRIIIAIVMNTHQQSNKHRQRWTLFHLFVMYFLSLVSFRLSPVRTLLCNIIYFFFAPIFCSSLFLWVVQAFYKARPLRASIHSSWRCGRFWSSNTFHLILLIYLDLKMDIENNEKKVINSEMEFFSVFPQCFTAAASEK